MTGHVESFRATHGRGAFTLVELLVSIGIMSVILVVLASITAQTETIWRGTTSKIEQFRGARTGFDTITERLRQATLNTYLGYSDGKGDTFYNDTTFAPTSFVRQSELRFLSGSCYIPSGTFQGTLNGFSGGSATTNPTQSVFFLAPLGYNTTATYQQLKQTLNVCGYYLQFGKDTSLPTFFTNAIGYQPRYRYRLMELLQPSENNAIYSTPSAWISGALNQSPPPVHILAENVIALIILPQLGQDQKTNGGTGPPFAASALAPNYWYDSTSLGAATSMSPTDPDTGTLDSNAQLPPIVQVTMVAIDEPSALRIQSQFGAAPPNFGLGTLFQDASKYAADLDQLQANLQQSTYTDASGSYNPTVGNLPKQIVYHIFTTTVSIKGAQWSTAQTN